MDLEGSSLRNWGILVKAPVKSWRILGVVGFGHRLWEFGRFYQ